MLKSIAAVLLTTALGVCPLAVRAAAPESAAEFADPLLDAAGAISERATMWQFPKVGSSNGQFGGCTAVSAATRRRKSTNAFKGPAA